MFARKDTPSPTLSERSAKDGRHCDLCGSPSPAVRCEKCGGHCFCMSCDDMYHRHPKRKSHQRKAADSLPGAGGAGTPGSRRALAAPGDPSKMPIPPPRKKKGKSIFSMLSGSSGSEKIPAIPKKEFSLTEKLGSIRNFMSNRPLPPIPKDQDLVPTPTARRSQSPRGPAAMQHMMERAPQSPKSKSSSEEGFPNNRPTSPQYQNILSHLTKLAQSSCEEWDEEPSTSGSTRGSSGAEDGGSGGGWGQEARSGGSRHLRGPPPLYPSKRGQKPHQLATDEWSGVGPLRRGQAALLQPGRGMPAPSRGMGQLSTSATDLTELGLTPQQQQQHLLQHPAGAVPGYPYMYPPGVPPLFPHFAPAQSMGRLNYPYYGGSWTNLRNKGNDADEENEDEEEDDGKRSTLTRRRHSESKMKRSQSVMYDPSLVPGPYFPFGAMPPPGYPGFMPPGPGYPYWGVPGAGVPLQPPPSPSASVRSLTRPQDRRQRRRQTDEGSSVSSYGGGKGGPRARRRPEDTDRDLSSDEELIDTDRVNPGDLKNPGDRKNPGNPGTHNPGTHNPGTHNPGTHNPGTKSEEGKDVPKTAESEHSNPGPGVPPPTNWECEFCTFINPAGSRICSICCKSISTASHREDPEEETTEAKKPIVLAEISEEVIKEQEQIEKEIRRQIEVKQKLSDESPGVLASQTSFTFTTEESETKNVDSVPSPAPSPTLIVGRISPKTSFDEVKTVSDTVTAKPGIEIETQTEQSIDDSTKADLNVIVSDISEPSKPLEVTIQPDKVANSIESATTTTEEPVQTLTPTKSDSSCQTNGDLSKLHPSLSVRPKNTQVSTSQGTDDITEIQIVVPQPRGNQVEMGTSPPPQDFGMHTPFEEIEHYEKRQRLGPIQRSLSQTSLNADREFRRKGHQEDGFGQLIRSLSRGSLASEPGGGGGHQNGRGSRNHPSAFAPVGSGPRGMYTSDWNLHRRTNWDEDENRFARPHTTDQWQTGNLAGRKSEYFLEELAERRRQEKMRTQGLEMVRMVRKAEQHGFVPDDLQVAIANCGDLDPVDWLEENWRNMIETVVTLATNYGHDKPDNDVGIVSAGEARTALRLHRGNIWAAVTECVETRQKKYLEIQKRGDFTRREIIKALTAQQGDTGLAYDDLLQSRIVLPVSPWESATPIAEPQMVEPRETGNSRFFAQRPQPPDALEPPHPRRSSLVENFRLPARSEARRFSYSASLSNEPRHLSPTSYFQPARSADVSDAHSFASEDYDEDATANEPSPEQEVKRDRLSWIKSKRTAQKEIKRSTSFLDKLAALRKDKKPEERKPNESKFLRYGSLNVLNIDMSGLRQASFEEYMKDVENKPEIPAQPPKQGLLSRLFNRGSSTDLHMPKSEFYPQTDGQHQMFDYPPGRMTQEYPVMKDTVNLNQLLSEASAIEKVQAYLNQIPGNQVSQPTHPTAMPEHNSSVSPQATLPTQMNFPDQNSQINSMLQHLGLLPQPQPTFIPSNTTEPPTEHIKIDSNMPMAAQYQPLPVQFPQTIPTYIPPSLEASGPTTSENHNQELKERVNNNNMKAQWLGINLEDSTLSESTNISNLQSKPEVKYNQKDVHSEIRPIKNDESSGINDQKNTIHKSEIVEEILLQHPPVEYSPSTPYTSENAEAIAQPTSHQVHDIGDKLKTSENSTGKVESPVMAFVESSSLQYDKQSPPSNVDSSGVTTSRPLGIQTSSSPVVQSVEMSSVSEIVDQSILPQPISYQENLPNSSKTAPTKLQASEIKLPDAPPDAKPRTTPKRRAKGTPLSVPQSKTEAKTVEDIEKVNLASPVPEYPMEDTQMIPEVTKRRMKGTPLSIPQSKIEVKTVEDTANVNLSSPVHTYPHVKTEIRSEVLDTSIIEITEPQEPFDSAQKESDFPFIVDELDAKTYTLSPEGQSLRVPQSSTLDDLSSTISDSVPEADEADIDSGSYTDIDNPEIALEDYVQAIVLDNIKIVTPPKEPSPEKVPEKEPPPPPEVKEDQKGSFRRRRRSVSRERGTKQRSTEQEAITTLDSLLSDPVIEAEPEPIPLPVAITSKGARRQRSISRDRRTVLGREALEMGKESAILRRRSSAKENTLDMSLAVATSELPAVKADTSDVRRKSLKDTKKTSGAESRIDKYKKKVPDKPKVVDPQSQLGPVMSGKRLAFDNRVKELLSKDTCATYEQAEMAARLMEMNFDEAEALQAAGECSSLYQAISYLQQDCELCAGKFPVAEMLSMLHCTHRACRNCLKTYFSIQIRDRNILELLCPYCSEPDLADDDKASEYFNHMDLMLKNLVDFDIHELFHRKLRDRALMKDPNFRWCSQCSSGFIINNPNQKRLLCPDCKAVTCSSCRKLWEKQHEGISCEQFQEWKEANDPELQAAGLAQHLAENGIDCPNCRFRYSLAKGGCMHFRCLQCQYDFCSGCSKPFKMGQKCGVSDFCAKLGLHAHHPRNCLFYLRDKEPTDLQKLLDEFEVPYNKDPPTGSDVKKVCQVMEQKETPSGLLDDVCGKEVLDGYGGLCRLHYTEFLVALINRYRLDPLPILDIHDLQCVLRRSRMEVPVTEAEEAEEEYRKRLAEVIREEMPLEKIEGS